MKAAKAVSRTFWCVEKDRMVTVEFVSHGSFLFRKETKILACSAFEDPSLINCTRRCLDPANRRLTPDWQVLGY